jgi:DNA-binding transcriptional regulator YdaS (Cro superfamily)
MAHDKPIQVILRSAADVVGGAEQLASALHVQREELDAWIAGRADPPPGALMDAVDLATIQAQLKDLPPA